MEAFTPTVETVYVIAIALLVIYLFKRWLFTRYSNLPPGPSGLPVIGSLHLFGELAHQNLAKMATEYGPLISLRLGQKLGIVASSPTMAMEFLKNQDANFSSRPYSRSSEVLSYQGIAFLNNTPVWRYLRKIFQVELTSAKKLEASRRMREDEMARMLRMVPQDGVVEVATHISTMVTNVISLMVFKKRFAELGGGKLDTLDKQAIKEFKDILDEQNQCLGAFNPGDYFPALKWLDIQGLEGRFKKLHNHMELCFSNVIYEHSQRRKDGCLHEQDMDMVDVLYAEMENKHEFQINEEHIKGVIWDAFGAGTDTSVLTTEWAMAEILANPNIMKAAQAELDEVIGRNRLVQESDIPKLKYIQAIVKETLRLHPPAPLLVPHQSIDTCEVSGYDIPTGTMLFVNVWAIGRDATVWEEPLRFNPNRFIEGGMSADVGMLGQHFQFLPFGAGRRACPGMAMGSLMVQSSLANLLHAFDWSLPFDMEPHDLDMSEGVGFTCPRAVPLHVLAKPRLPTEIYKGTQLS